MAEKTAEDSRRLFHALNIKAQATQIAKQYIKLNVIQNMALSLAAIMAVAGSVFLIETILFVVTKNKAGFILTTIFFILSLLLFYVFIKRYLRFNRYWVRNIVYATATNEDLYVWENDSNGKTEKKEN